LCSMLKANNAITPLMTNNTAQMFAVIFLNGFIMSSCRPEGLNGSTKFSKKPHLHLRQVQVSGRSNVGDALRLRAGSG